MVLAWGSVELVLEGPLLRPQLLRLPARRFLVALEMELALVQQAPMQWLVRWVQRLLRLLQSMVLVVASVESGSEQQ